MPPVLIRNDKTILLCGCEHETRILLEPTIRSLGFSLECAHDSDAVQSYLHSSEREIAALILDLIRPGDDSFRTVQGVRSLDPHLPIIVVSARPSTEDVVTAMKSGATEFLSAPIDHESIIAVLNRAVNPRESGPGSLQSSQQDANFFIGVNPRMAEIHALAAQVGHSKVPVLIQGETGTGKEVLARAIHSRSQRANRPFLKLNCAALPSELVESELFGYERGAFTGAFKRKEGMFELADGGTLLLDEIGDMDIRLQAKLLQVLQDREFRRIGGKETIRVDVRIIAASHRDLEQAIDERNFREDLYYRLNVVNLVVPPLRERKEDIGPITDFLVKKHSSKETAGFRINIELRQAMLAYHWPGNVRELENYVRKLLIFKDCNLIARELRARISRKQPAGARQLAPGPAPAPVAASKGFSALDEARHAKERAEVEVILSALSTTHWNRKQAAVLLNIDYKSLLYKMKKLGIDSSPVAIAEQIEPVEPISARRSATGD